MMMKELRRQLFAGILASISFVVIFNFFSLQWIPALVMSIAVYFAVLLLVKRTPEAHEVYLYANITQSDVDEAVNYCENAAKKLVEAANKIGKKNIAKSLQRLSALILDISDSYKDDARDLKHSRSFVNHYLPKLLQITDNYVVLGQKRLSRQGQMRLAKIGQNINGYIPHFQSIYDACLENDFKKLELETSILGDVMKIQTK